MTDVVLLGADWGSTSVRVFAIAADGGIADVRRADDGVFVGEGAFAARLQRHMGDWLARWPAAPILLCGMIGSDRGWVHAPYTQAPASLESVANALVPVPYVRAAHIVPGVAFTSGQTCDVMRGEETLLLGLGARFADATVCLPGTHSKWARLSGGRIASFRTSMTGELRALLLGQSALATAAAQEVSREAFRAGLAAAQSGTGLSAALFQARARRLLGRLADAHTASFLSGVLIGAEVAAEAGAPGGEIVLAARGGQAEDYAMALAGHALTIVDPEPLAASALLLIARAAGLVPGPSM